MSDTGNIDPDTDTGDPKDNGQSWNYVKFMAECVNRTQPLGENENENDGDGTACYSAENEPLNMHFRTYTMDLSVNGAIKDNRQSTPISTGAGDSSKGKVGPNGWVFPTIASDTIVRQFGVEGFTGVDIAGSSVALTNQQPIYAAKSGTVIAAGKAAGYGNWVVIQNDPDTDGKAYYTVYGNIDDDGILVNSSDVNKKVHVNAGDQIAKIGGANTKNGPHLRFEVWDGSPLAGGKPIDPTTIVNGARPAAGGTS
jgi:murein DD-endopeptidase MepM/ murein hydrolase activator NlpD